MLPMFGGAVYTTRRGLCGTSCPGPTGEWSAGCFFRTNTGRPSPLAPGATPNRKLKTEN